MVEKLGGILLTDILLSVDIILTKRVVLSLVLVTWRCGVSELRRISSLLFFRVRISVLSVPIIITLLLLLINRQVIKVFQLWHVCYNEVDISFIKQTYLKISQIRH